MTVNIIQHARLGVCGDCAWQGRLVLYMIAVFFRMTNVLVPSEHAMVTMVIPGIPHPRPIQHGKVQRSVRFHLADLAYRSFRSGAAPPFEAVLPR